MHFKWSKSWYYICQSVARYCKSHILFIISWTNTCLDQFHLLLLLERQQACNKQRIIPTFTFLWSKRVWLIWLIITMELQWNKIINQWWCKETVLSSHEDQGMHVGFIMEDVRFLTEVFCKLSMEVLQMFFLIPSKNLSMGLKVQGFIFTMRTVPRPAY